MRHLFFSLAIVFCLQAGAQQQRLFYPSGNLQYSYELKDGKFNGSFTSYFDNGLVKSKGNFTDGKRTGTWQAWDEEGMLRIKRSFDDKENVDLVAEWNSTGCKVDAVYLENKERKLNSSLSVQQNYKDIFWSDRFWKSILPRKENELIYSNSFINYLQEEIKAGRLIVFSDERFVHNLAASEASAITDKKLTLFLIREQHDYSVNIQQMMTHILGLGLSFGQGDDKKVVWVFYPDLRKAAQQSPVVDGVVAALNNQDFVTDMDMTTFQSTNGVARKPADGEKIYLRLAEIDLETTSWIYLLDKDLVATNR